MAVNEAANLFAPRPGRLFTIGQVIDKIKVDFPDLTPSKIRFLEDQGLFSPFRTESGYRKYSEQHIERMRLILELQRDKFLPLKVIKTYLEPKFEAIFNQNSYGYRPLRGAHDAIKQVQQNNKSYAWVIDMDIKAFFDDGKFLHCRLLHLCQLFR